MRLLHLLLVVAAHARSIAPTISVFGHKIPDTDAICAALAYAWELEGRGLPATAYRLGELNRETEYVLKALGLEQPALLGELEVDALVAMGKVEGMEWLSEVSSGGRGDKIDV